MSDYENYQEASGWLGPEALALGMYGRRLQFIVFDEDGNRETVLTGILRSVDTERTSWGSVGNPQEFSNYRHTAHLAVRALNPSNDPGNLLSLPLVGNILWKEIP